MKAGTISLLPSRTTASIFSSCLAQRLVPAWLQPPFAHTGMGFQSLTFVSGVS